MDKPSEGANRDIFLWKVLEQFGVIASLLPKPFAARPWEDKDIEEEGWKVRLDVWGKEDGEDDTVLRLTAYFDDAGAERAGWDQKLRLVAEWQGEETELLVLGWKDSAPDPRKGLNSPADYAEGEYEIGKVTRGLRADVMATLRLQPASASRELTLPSRRGPPAVIDAAFEPLAPIARAERAAPAVSGAVAKQGEQAPEGLDLSLLEKVLAGREGSRAVRRYLAAVEGNLRAGNLNETLVAALIEQGLRAHYAVLRAEITGGSFSTGIGVAIKKWSRPAALGVAGLVEFVEGIYAIGPLVGDNYATAGLALVQSVLFGAGLSQVSKPGVEKKSWAVLLGAWSIGLTALVANNPELQRLAQTHVFQLEQPAREAVARLNRAEMREGRVAEDVARSRDNQKGALGVKGRGTAAAVRTAKEEVTEAIGRRDSADDEIANAKRDTEKALADDPSRTLAFMTLALLFGSVSVGSGLYVARYLETAGKEHTEALEKSRDRTELKGMLAHVRDHPDAVAAEFFGVLKGLYAEVLQYRGMQAREAQKKAEREFGDGEAIRLASARFSGKKYRPPKAARDARPG